MRALRAGRPLWLDLNSHRSANTYPLLAGHQAADVVIVGGGMTGSTIAAMFADAGVRVALVEAALIGRGIRWRAPPCCCESPIWGCRI